MGMVRFLTDAPTKELQQDKLAGHELTFEHSTSSTRS